MTDYWESRKDMLYYQKIREYMESVPGRSVMDVGCRDCPVVTWGMFQHRLAVDAEVMPELPGVLCRKADFMQQRWSRVDLIMCLQVLEHLREPRAFTKRLFEVGRKVLISVPYRWPAGLCKHHVHDPLDLRKLLLWCLPHEPERLEIVKEKTGESRLIALYTSSI